MYHSITREKSVEDVAKNVDIVTMGINPSRYDLHQGHYLTQWQAMKAILQNNSTRGFFFIDDREFHFPVKGSFHKEIQLPTERAVREIRTRMEQFIAQAAQEIGESSLPDRITLLRMSDYLQNGEHGRKNGGQLYELLWDYRGTISDTLEFGSRQEHHLMTRPACPRCNSLQQQESRVAANREHVRSSCQDAICPHKEYIVYPRNGDKNWAMHYTVDPLRDVLLAAKNDARVLHVFGGDYGIPWGERKIPKAMRLSGLITRINRHVRVDHFVGPLLARNGTKLSKSNDDRAEAPSVKYLDQILHARKPVVEMNSLKSAERVSG